MRDITFELAWKERDIAHAKEHCPRPWWKRPPFWFIGIAAVVLVVVVVAERSGNLSINTNRHGLMPRSMNNATTVQME